VAVERLGKRIVLALDGDHFLVVHLMIAGRLHWRDPLASIGARNALAAFDFDHGALVLTEAGTKRRASLHAVRSRAALTEHDPGGLEVMEADRAAFVAALRRERHTLKRALTDPSLFSGIGNTYSDEILHAARLSPVVLTSSLTDEEATRLHDATVDVMTRWIDHLTAEAGDGFPEKVSAFRPGMAVHGRFRQPCPRCGTAIQRIVRGEHESNYCPTCQTGGRLLADRALSRLLGADWPHTVDELERRRATMRAKPT
jgi:formamidopyrimidine-DNA glycosylase